MESIQIKEYDTDKNEAEYNMLTGSNWISHIFRWEKRKDTIFAKERDDWYLTVGKVLCIDGRVLVVQRTETRMLRSGLRELMSRETFSLK